MRKEMFDIVVIGAGPAGLFAAGELARGGRSVAVIEAKEKAGGRTLSIVQEDVLFELGAEFMHGNLPITMDLLKKTGVKYRLVEGSIWQHNGNSLVRKEDFIEDYADLEKKLKGLSEDKTVAAFLAADLAGEEYDDLRKSLWNYVAGYYAADPEKCSTFALRRELTEGDEEQYRLVGGYPPVIKYLEKNCREAGVQFFYGRPVSEIAWKKNNVQALANGAVFRGCRALLTVPIGTLQQEEIQFSPELPHVKNAAKRLGFGHVIKVVLHFTHRFWQDQSVTRGEEMSDMSFLFSEQAIPTWWTHAGANDSFLVGWLAGPKAAALGTASETEVVKMALNSLAQIFALKIDDLQNNLRAARYHNWSADPNSRGAYSYEVVGGEAAVNELKAPVESTLFFAGEGLQAGPEIGTVEAAFRSAREAVDKIDASFHL